MPKYTVPLPDSISIKWLRDRQGATLPALWDDEEGEPLDRAQRGLVMYLLDRWGMLEEARALGHEAGVVDGYHEGAAFERTQMVVDQWREPSPGVPPQAWFVYLVKGESYHKIGISTDVARRLKELQNQAGAKFLEVVTSVRVEDAKKREAELHARYASRRVKGEWFDLTAEEADEVSATLAEWSGGPDTDEPTG